MTLLIFLVSVAVVESILRRDQTPQNDEKQAWARQFLGRHRQPGPAATPGLHALGQALERHGHGRAPAPVPASAAKVPAAEPSCLPLP